jgi:membrane protease YdiL (CAAX protease family)
MDPVDSMEPLDSPSPGPTGAPPLAPRRSFFRGVPWRWSDVLIGLVPLVSLRATNALIAPALLLAAPHWLWLPIAILAYAWVLIYPLSIARRRNAGLPRLPRPRTIFVEALFALLAVVAVQVVQATFFLSLSYLFGDQAVPRYPFEPIVRSPNRIESLGFLILVVLVTPVAEEVFFRGMFYNALRQRLNPVVAAPLQAVVFALLHPYGLVGSAAVALYGLAFALIYEWRKTLLAPVLLHTLVNAVVMAVMVWGIAADAAAPRFGVYGETHQDGCLVTKVVPNTAADTAGLQIGDVVITLDGDPVADMRSLTQAVRTKQVGQKVVVEFIRRGKTHQVDAILKKLQE